MNVFWTVPPLPTGVAYEQAFRAMLDVAAVAGYRGYIRIDLPYMRTDQARNQACWTFLEMSKDPDDMLVMLDADHIHKSYTLERLASHPVERGVVGALAFRREAPFNPLFFFYDVATRIYRLPGLPVDGWGATYECDALATCAIGIRRWVLEKTKRPHGGGWNWFRYSYGRMHDTTEDMYFAFLCQRQGIHQYCDTSLVADHLRVQQVDDLVWSGYLTAHPDLLVEKETNDGST
jgi:hypothetical protein